MRPGTAFAKVGVLMASARRTAQACTPPTCTSRKALPRDTVQSRLPDPAWLEHWLDKQIQFDSVWENKVVERILHNLSFAVRPQLRQRSRTAIATADNWPPHADGGPPPTPLEWPSTSIWMGPISGMTAVFHQYQRHCAAACRTGLQRHLPAPSAHWLADFSSNDYLGLSRPPRDHCRRPPRAGSIRHRRHRVRALLSGNWTCTGAFEARIAADKHTESALIFGSVTRPMRPCWPP